MPVTAMLQLSVAPSGHTDIPLPADASEAEEWRQADGTITAIGYSMAGWQWMQLPGVATFRFNSSSSEVTAFAEPSCSGEALRETFERCVLPMALQVRGLEALHASGIRARHGVVAFCATADTGKSTLAYGLALRGYPLWADDAVVFRSDQEGIHALPIPFRVRLNPASANFFGDSPAAQEEQPAGARALAGVCVLERVLAAEPRPPVEITQLRSSRALAALLTHAYCFDLRNKDRKRRMIRNYLDLICQVPVYEVRFQAGFDKLPALLDAVEHTILG